MSILLDNNTRVLCQGITGKQATFHVEQCIKYGTNIVAGVSPKKAGTTHLGVPVFATVQEACTRMDIDATMIFVSAPFCKQALLDAIEANIKLIVCITEGIPVIDMLEINELAKIKGITLIGPNSPGIISSGLAKLGIMPISIHARGSVGIMSRSGTLTYEVIKQTSDYGFGQTTCIGIGGDSIVGSSFIDIIKHFEEDEETKAIVMLGEIGGNSEEEVSLYIKEHVNKPVIAYIAGVSAPKGKRMGHAGAITSGGQLSASEKKAFLRKNGIIVVDSIFDIGKSLSIILGKETV